MQVYCVYPAISKSPMQMSILSKNSRNKHDSNHYYWCPVSHLFPFLTVALHESGTRKAISWSVIVYNKKLSCQCNLTVQIEPMQDKLFYLDSVVLQMIS